MSNRYEQLEPRRELQRVGDTFITEDLGVANDLLEKALEVIGPLVFMRQLRRDTMLSGMDPVEWEAYSDAKVTMWRALDWWFEEV